MKRALFAAVILLLLLAGCQQEVFDPAKSLPGVEKRERIRTIKSVEGSLPGVRGVAVTDKLWTPGDTVRIKFLNGGNTIREKVKTYVARWLEHAYLVFDYVGINEEADVKIGFDMDDRWLSWSTIGTDCRQVPQDEPSLNFVWLEDEPDTNVIRGEVLRGFGHVLGLGFEHRNPESPVIFNARARTLLINNWGLSEEDVDNHILPFYTTDQTNYTEYDRNSIMVLEIPSTILSNRGESTTFNMELSGNDTTFIAKLYPYPLIRFVSNITHGIGHYSISIHATEDVFVDWGNGDTTWIPAGTTSPDLNYSLFPYPALDTTRSQIIKIYGSRTAIRGFSCYGKWVTEIDVTRNRNLEVLHCNENKLTKLDVSKNTKIWEIQCHENRITELSFTSNNDLTLLWCFRNPLHSLNVTQNTELADLNCSYTELTSLDISQNTKLHTLFCSNEWQPQGGYYITISLQEFLKIANDIVDRQGKSPGMIGCEPYTQEASSILNEKNWY